MIEHDVKSSEVLDLSDDDPSKSQSRDEFLGYKMYLSGPTTGRYALHLAANRDQLAVVKHILPKIRNLLLSVAGVDELG